LRFPFHHFLVSIFVSFSLTCRFHSYFVCFFILSRDSTVGIATFYRLGSQEYGVQVPVLRDFSPPFQFVHPGFGATLPSYLMDTEAYFNMHKAAGA
jgi:hypothetical protein